MQGVCCQHKKTTFDKHILIFHFNFFFISNKGPGLYSGEKGIKSTYFSGFCHLGPKFHIVFIMYCISIVP